MQDSSLNPYIPQESDTVRRQTETLHSPLKRLSKLLLIITTILAILVGAGLFFVVPKTATLDKQARVDLANALQPPAQLAKLVPVTSTLGFSLQYDNQLFTSYGETVPPKGADGKPQTTISYFENDDLRVAREYNLLRITPAQNSDSDRANIADPPQLVIASSVSPDDLKTAAAKPDYKGLSNLSLFVRLDNDRRLAAKTSDDGTTVSVNATKPSNRTIGGIAYQKVRYTTKNDNYRISNEKYDDCYYTIQNEQPYSACVTNVRPSSIDSAALDEQLLQSLTFQKPKTDTATTDTAQTTDKTTTKTQDTADSTKSDDTSNDTDQDQKALISKIPAYNSDWGSLGALAKNQPSSVRIATIYCADISLKLQSGAVQSTLTDACSSNLSSGVVVSKDGYIATTGHAIRYAPKDIISGYLNSSSDEKDQAERLQRILDYLLKSGLIKDSDAQYLKIGAQVGDQEALAKIENIGALVPDDFVTATNDSYSYAIQPIDKPVVVNTSSGSRPTFAYSDSVITAKYVASDYDATKASQYTFGGSVPSSDVGLLKADGNFQNATVTSGDSLKSNDGLTAIGYPSATGAALTIAKNQNTPVVVNSKVNQTYDKDGHRLVQATVPMVPGLDGSGVFSNDGNLVGFGVYGLPYCPDQNCFANGTVRSSSELLKLIDGKNMSLGELSDASKTWNNAVDEYFKANYSAATAGFSKAGSQYRFNNYAAPLQKLAQSKQGSSSDTSLFNQLQGVMVGVLIFMIVATILLAIVFFLQKRRLDSLRTGHYGSETPTYGPQPVMTNSQPPVQQPFQQQQPPVYQQQPMPQQPMPQQPVNQPQQYQPQSYQPQPTQPQQPTYPQQQSNTPPQQPQQPPEDPFYRG